MDDTPEDIKKLIFTFWERKNGGHITSGSGVKYPVPKLLADLGQPADKFDSPGSVVKGATNWLRRGKPKPKVLNLKVMFDRLKNLQWPKPCPHEAIAMDSSISISESDSVSVTSSGQEEDEESSDNDLDLCYQLSLVNLTKNHYIYIFACIFSSSEQTQTEDEIFSSFIDALFYVGQGTSGDKNTDRFEIHFINAEKPSSLLFPLEKVMKQKKKFFAEIIWDRLSKPEADYLEKKLISEAIAKGKHLWAYHGNKHTCTAKRITKQCLCNQQLGNTHDPFPEDSPHRKKSLFQAFKKFMDITDKANTSLSHTRLRTAACSPDAPKSQKINSKTLPPKSPERTPNLSHSHRIPVVPEIRTPPQSPTKCLSRPKTNPVKYFVKQEKDIVYHFREGCCEAKLQIYEIDDMSPCKTCSGTNQN